MKKFKLLFFKKFTLGNILTVFGTLIYAILFRYFIQHFFDVYPIRGSLTVLDLSYFLSIATWKFLFSIFLELFLGEKFTIPIGSFICNSNSTTLYMDKSNFSESSSNPSKAENTSSDNKSLTIDESYALLDEMQSNLKRQAEMMSKLNSLKNSKDLKYYDVNKALEVDFPSTMEDTEIKRLSSQIGIIDRIYTTKYDEYKELEKRDSTLNNSRWKSILSDQKSTYRGMYKDLFEK